MSNDEILQVLREMRHAFEESPVSDGIEHGRLNAVRLRRIEVLKHVEKMLDDKGPRLDAIDEKPWQPACVVPDPDGVHPKRDGEPE